MSAIRLGRLTAVKKDDGHGEDHMEEDHHYLIKDLQTEDNSFYTIAQEFPNDFAKPSRALGRDIM